ncbi:MAG TPA: hypothetical protein DCM54_18100 [Gammaproteobacteria bacterium]|nr:hypothetical protein [Gammaproteobacteria bacterium]
MGVHIQMIKNIVILALFVVNGTLVYAFVVRNPPPPPQPFTPQIVPVNQDMAQEATLEPAPLELITPRENYGTLTEQLRERGVSEDLIRQMVLATIDRDFLLDQQAQRIDTPYWKRPPRDNYETVLATLELEDNKRNMLLEIFGDEIIDDPLFENLFKPLNETLAFLSSDKQIALDSLIRSNQAASTPRDGGFLRENWVDRQTSEQDLERAIQELLSQDEYMEYQLRESALAGTMRRSMDGLDSSEQEYRDIYEIRNALETNAVTLSGREGRQELLAAREEANQQIEDYLGPQRFEEYERLQDPVYRSLQSVGERYGTSDANVLAVYEVTNDAASRIQEVTENSDLSRSERRQKMSEIQTDTHVQVTDILGEEAAKSVQQNTSRFIFRRAGRGSRR